MISYGTEQAHFDLAIASGHIFSKGNRDGRTFIFLFHGLLPKDGMKFIFYYYYICMCVCMYVYTHTAYLYFRCYFIALYKDFSQI